MLLIDIVVSGVSILMCVWGEARGREVLVRRSGG